MVQGKQRVVSYKVHDKITVPEEEWFVKENTHEPTFTQEEYDTLERLLSRDTRSPTGKHVLHLFAGFLKCKDCGKALQRKSAKEKVYYACRTYTEKSKDKCTKHSIRLDLLEKAVLASIQAQLALADSLKDIAAEISRTPKADTQAVRTRKLLGDKKQEAERIRTVADNLYVDWKDGEISRADYQRMKEKFEKQLEQLETVILNLEEEQRRTDNSVNDGNPLFTELLKHNNIEKLDRGLLVELVDTVYVHEGKEITIVFRFQDELPRILEFAEISTEQQKAN